MGMVGAQCADPTGKLSWPRLCQVGSRADNAFSTARFMTLLYFAQSLFLVFASVYIAKESIETVLLGEGAHSHGGGHGHGHGGEVDHTHEDGLEDERYVVPAGVSKAKTYADRTSAHYLSSCSPCLQRPPCFQARCYGTTRNWLNVGRISLP